MRINEIARYTAANQLASRAKASPSGSVTAAAQQANQTRLSDAARGYSQASQVRDAAASSKSALASASEAVTKLQDQGLSAADRTKYQQQYRDSLAAAEQAAKSQESALGDKKLANGSFAARRTGSLALDKLGQRSSDTFSSVAELKKLDPATATADQLKEAAKVLETAQAQTGRVEALAGRQADRIAGKVAKMEGADLALSGGQKLDLKTSRNLAAVQALMDQARNPMAPGSLFNSII